MHPWWAFPHGGRGEAPNWPGLSHSFYTAVEANLAITLSAWAVCQLCPQNSTSGTLSYLGDHSSYEQHANGNRNSLLFNVLSSPETSQDAQVLIDKKYGDQIFAI